MTAVRAEEPEARLPSIRYLEGDELCRDEGLEVVISNSGDEPEFHLPDVDGSSAPLDPSKSARASKSASEGNLGVAIDGGGPAGPRGAGRGAPASAGDGPGNARKGRRAYRRSASESDAQDEAKKLGYVQMARLGYQELVNAIIRPPRAEYREEMLGPANFNFCGKRFHRRDFVLKNQSGYLLRCSHWEPVTKPAERIPVVIYMHGNSSARVEVIPQLSYLLSLGLAIFSFDFAGSGKSDGEYVSLGYHEREDLMCVIAFLRKTNAFSTIALWGRSMGAATALMHGDRDPSIACMVLDSPFADLTQLAEEMVERGKQQGINVPNFVTAVALRMIRGSVKKQANFDIKAISPISHADRCFIPALFVAGEHDDFISKRHSEAIHARYAGDKNLIVVEGDHNSPRPKFMFDSVSIFLQTCLQVPASWALKVPPGMNLMAPPWFFPGSVDGNVSPADSRAPSRSPSRRNSSFSSRASPSRKSSSVGNSASVSGAGENGQQNSATAASARSAEEMGMTLERQREIQASLFKMLGQPSEEDTSSRTRRSSSSVSSRRSSKAGRSRSSSRVRSSSSLASAGRTSSTKSTTSGPAGGERLAGEASAE